MSYLVVSMSHVLRYIHTNQTLCHLLLSDSKPMSTADCEVSRVVASFKERS
jgi:hypothetical protein